MAGGHERRTALPIAMVLVALLGSGTALAQVTGGAGESGASPPLGGAGLPNIVLIVVDTLRADRLSAYGNAAPTSPNIDALLGSGARFTNARTVEPLTGPAAASILTSLHPHEHGISRNGIPMRKGLRSLPEMLARLGYVTVAFVSNWTLADKQSGLAAHFDVYQEIFTKKRWLFWFGESDAEDVRSAAVTWVQDVGTYDNQPLFMWVHFVEPHAPYELQEDFAPRLGVKKGSSTAAQRYDTEIAAVDDAIGHLLQDLGRYMDLDRTLFIFASDHGEGLGEHGYKGHGRRLYEEELRIPLGFTWRGRIPPATPAAPASLIDLAPTVMGLLGAPSPPEWRGFDWSGALLSGTEGPMDRAVYFQAHKGVATRASGNAEVANNKRRRGLLKLGVVRGDRKQVFDVSTGTLKEDILPHAAQDGGPGYAGAEASAGFAPPNGALPSPLQQWKDEIEKGLAERDRSPPPRLSDEALERLRSLGYTN